MTVLEKRSGIGVPSYRRDTKKKGRSERKCDECTSHLVEYAATRTTTNWRAGYYNYLYTNARARLLEEIEEIGEIPYQKPLAKTPIKNTLASGGGQTGERAIKMNLGSEQYFIYAWRYRGDTEACKLGVSMLRTFYARIKAARTVTYQEIELLGIEVFDTEAEARAIYKERLEAFERIADRRAWVVFDAAVREWLDTVCVSDPPTLDAFKDVFQKDPVRREKEREYQRRHRIGDTIPSHKSQQKRTEKDRAYDREYQRKRREKDPEYKEKQKQRQKAWRAKNPEYDKNRYANDPAYAEQKKATRRKKYAEDPEYREREKQRRREFARDNPEYKEKRKLYMREYRRRKRAEGEKV